MNYDRAKDFAAQVGAKVTLPSEPNRPWVHSSRTDIRKTLERFRPVPDFITGEMMAEAYADAPQSWRMT